MNPESEIIKKFLARVRRDHDERLEASCREVVEALPPGTPFNPLYVLGQAKLRLQEDSIQDFAVMNATAFYSARKRHS